MDRIDRVIALLLANQGAIVAAIDADFGGRSSHQTRMGDLYATLETLKYAREHVDSVHEAREAPREHPARALRGPRARGVPAQGRGGHPRHLELPGEHGALAAGERVGRRQPRAAEVLGAHAAHRHAHGRAHRSRFSETELACVEGGPDVGAAFAALPLDHLVFTGSGATGALVMQAAATHLTPLTLELGGKSPVIVAPDADIAGAAQRIMEGKALNSGQACLAPDVVFVPRGQRETFVAHAKRTVEHMFPTLRGNPDLTAIVNARHAERLRGYVAAARAAGADVVEVNPSGEPLPASAAERRLPYTFVLDPDPALAVMQEELFGPLLVVRTYRTLDDCWRAIQAGPRPLGLYVFTHNAETQRAALDQTHSGGVTFNDVLTHASQDDLPFGGIGPSGMGRYRGIEGFREFSHPRPVFHASRVPLQRLSGLVPPFGARAEQTLARILRGR
jgi:coniferyl-aldehyde dehydrogenase